MNKPHEFHRDWEKIKKQLASVGQEAVKLAKKGEKEVVRLSHEGKLLFDSTTLSMKKEKIFYLIGKEYIKAKYPEKPTAKMQKLLEDFKTLDQKQKQLKAKAKKTKKKSAK